MLTLLALASCLPDVSTETSEIEARAILQSEMRDLCRDQLSAVAWDRVLATIRDATIRPTRDYWEFKITPSAAAGELEVLVFPSTLVYGSYLEYMESWVCK